MPRNLRIATFNCENLFSRPRIFFESDTRSRELLGFVAELQSELRKPVFDHARIAALKKKLAGFATINDIRGKHASAPGAAAWIGWVELTRDRISPKAVENTARVIAAVDADIICLMEIEDRLRLQCFHDEELVPKFLEPNGRPPYEEILLIDGNDERRIDVAIMSRLPIDWVRSHLHERSQYQGRTVRTFSRDCLEVDFASGGGRSIRLLVNHFKSMGYSPRTDPQSNERRRGQAERVAAIAGALDLDKRSVVIAGDLNSPPESPSLAPLTQHPKLLNVNTTLPEAERGTYRTGRKQLDYLFVSTPLKARLRSVQIERRGIFSKTRPHFPEVEDETTAASDHAAVVADFSI
jgi:endonuclease/exonuclease/phosphatase family metal-dependent hydrolase